MEHQEMEGLSPEEKKARFKEATVTHRLLEQTDRAIMRAIREHGWFAYVFVYGPSGVGKTTMIHQVSRRFDGTVPSPRSAHFSLPLSGSRTVVPVLVLETRPPDGAAFNRADYYRNALVKLGEPFYEHRRLIDIHTEQTIEKPSRRPGKAAHFNESPGLRHAMEEAMQRHDVQAVILDEAQHLMTMQGATEGTANSSPQGEPTTVPSGTEPSPKLPPGRIGKRAPRRDPVGVTSSEEKPKRCSFSGVVELSPARLPQAAISKLQCPECGAMWTARIREDTVLFPPHPPRTTRVAQAIPRWIKRGTTWTLSEKNV